MGPGELMNSLLLKSSSDSMTLSVLKLCDDRSNWSDYQSRIERAMGLKGLWRHMLGTTVVPNPFVLLNGIPVLADKKTEATEEQIEAQEIRIMDFEKKEYLTQHIILSMTSTHLGSKIKELKTEKEMWKVVVADVTMKSTLLSEDTSHNPLSLSELLNLMLPIQFMFHLTSAIPT